MKPLARQVFRHLARGTSDPDGTLRWYGGGRLAAGLTLSGSAYAAAERPMTFRHPRGTHYGDRLVIHLSP